MELFSPDIYHRSKNKIQINNDRQVGRRCLTQEFDEPSRQGAFALERSRIWALGTR